MVADNMNKTRKEVELNEHHHSISLVEYDNKKAFTTRHKIWCHQLNTWNNGGLERDDAIPKDDSKDMDKKTY